MKSEKGVIVGIEKEEEYVKIINARLTQVNLLSFGGQE